MSTFSYTVHDNNGKILSGAIESRNREEAAQTLLNQGLTPVTIRQVQKGILEDISRRFTFISSADKVLFAEELSTLVNAGVPIAQSLNMLEKQLANKKFKKALSELSRDVEGGLSLSTAMERHPDIFSPVFVHTVRAGEAAGTLDEALKNLAVQLAKDHELVSKIRGAMIYPIVIMVAMTGAMIYMMMTVVPELTAMFADLGGELPATTKSLILLSTLLGKYGFITFTLIGLSAYGFFKAEKNYKPLRLLIHKIFLHLPVIGKLTVKVNVARFSRTLGSLLTSGVPLPEALKITSDSTNNLIFKEAINKTGEKVRNGSTVADVIKNYKVFPILVPQMITVGEETGELPDLLTKIANFYDREVDNITRNLTTLLEPMIMLIIGAMVGYLIISIITPIYSMTNMM
jgi:type IV pilus assembly protein PilC